MFVEPATDVIPPDDDPLELPPVEVVPPVNIPPDAAELPPVLAPPEPPPLALIYVTGICDMTRSVFSPHAEPSTAKDNVPQKPRIWQRLFRRLFSKSISRTMVRPIRMTIWKLFSAH